MIGTVDVGVDQTLLSNLSESVSRQADGKLTITLANLSADEDYPVEVSLLTASEEQGYDLLEAKILAGDKDRLDKHNSFDQPDEVEPEDYAAAVKLKQDGHSIETEIPAASVLLIRLAPKA